MRFQWQVSKERVERQEHLLLAQHDFLIVRAAVGEGALNAIADDAAIVPA